MSNYTEIKKYCEDRMVTLVAISKTKTVAEILSVYEQGQKIFGENKVQELVSKFESPLLNKKDIEWHLVGHLQTNKVKFIAPFVSLIHGVDSFKLLEEINKQAEKNNRIINVLLQIYIAQEETKFGLSFEEATALLGNEKSADLKNICIKGLMGMATLTENESQIRKEFSSLKNFFTEFHELKFLSMGMSGDHKIAIEEGSNMVRIGSAIFGERNLV
ncbi:MAG: YggS family pyridoxal phosphate-dependent enzyme [Chitinophagales bacterium]|nr:YggS family pyridoxal phosphate-dependent enzyme [Chitinophagales bacterium]